VRGASLHVLLQCRLLDLLYYTLTTEGRFDASSTCLHVHSIASGAESTLRALCACLGSVRNINADDEQTTTTTMRVSTGSLAYALDVLHACRARIPLGIV
jgi:hypothetical protein